MPTLQDTINELDVYFSLIQGEIAKKERVPRQAFRDESKYEKVVRAIDENIKAHRLEIERSLQLYDREPERHYLRHGQKLAKLHEGGSYDESVFIMTKFPPKDAQDEPAKKLQSVIDAVVNEVREHHYKPRIAYEQDLQDWIWDNVELFLFGCARGIAIIEGQYLPELNPNVAMEWGWMKAMGKPVLFLMEKSFKYIRADWSGLDPKIFEWDKPTAGIQEALEKWLP
jgi:hypothetical protein